MNSGTVTLPSGSYQENTEPQRVDFGFRNVVPPKRYSPPMKSDHGSLASKEKATTESSSDPEFDEAEEEEEDFTIKQKEDDEEEYTIFSKGSNIPSTKFKKSRSPGGLSKTIKTSLTQNKKKKVCEFCGCSDTPMWRRGPQGKGTLCNACGVKWSLKFRKKNGLRRESPSATDAAEKVKGATRKSSRKDKPSFSIRKGKEMLESPPHYPSYQYEDSYQNEMFCKSCGVNWPLSYFRGSTFGQCNNCSRKQMIMIRSDSPPEKLEQDDDMYLPTREAKRRRGLEDYMPDYHIRAVVDSDDINEDSTSDLDVDIRANRLFGSLLNVVENKLVEVQELEGIKKELDDWKQVVLLKEDQRQRTVDEAQTRLFAELSQFRQSVVSMVTSVEETFGKRLCNLERDFLMVNQQTESMKANIQELRSLLKTQTSTEEGKSLASTTDSPLALKIDTLQRQLELLQKKLDGHHHEVKSHVGAGMQELKKALVADLDCSEQRVSSEIAMIKKQSQEDLEHVKQQMDRMDYIFEKNERSTP